MIHAIDQRSPEWTAIRLGKATASKIADIVAKTKSGYATSRSNYAAQLISERLTGAKAESFSNAAMAWGTAHEPEARDAYSFLRDVDVEEVGFVDHPSIAMSGASPDGMIGADGLIEIKAPNTATHIDTLLSGKVPGKYAIQMQWQMACTGRQWCDFVSYDPRLPEEKSMFIKRVLRDDERITELEAEVRTFLAEIDGTIARLNAAYPAANDLSDFVTDEQVAMLAAG